MKLADLIKEIENIDQEAIIFQEDRKNPNSDIYFLLQKKEMKELK